MSQLDSRDFDLPDFDIEDQQLNAEAQARREFTTKMVVGTGWTALSVLAGVKLADYIPNKAGESADENADRMQYLLNRIYDRCRVFRSAYVYVAKADEVVTLTTGKNSEFKDGQSYGENELAEISIALGAKQDPPYVTVDRRNNDDTNSDSGTKRFLLTELDDNKQLDEMCVYALGDGVHKPAVYKEQLREKLKDLVDERNRLKPALNN